MLPIVHAYLYRQGKIIFLENANHADFYIFTSVADPSMLLSGWKGEVWKETVTKHAVDGGLMLMCLSRNQSLSFHFTSSTVQSPAMIIVMWSAAWS